LPEKSIAVLQKQWQQTKLSIQNMVLVLLFIAAGIWMSVDWEHFLKKFVGQLAFAVEG